MISARHRLLFELDAFLQSGKWKESPLIHETGSTGGGSPFLQALHEKVKQGSEAGSQRSVVLQQVSLCSVNNLPSRLRFTDVLLNEMIQHLIPGFSAKSYPCACEACTQGFKLNLHSEHCCLFYSSCGFKATGTTKHGLFSMEASCLHGLIRVSG